MADDYLIDHVGKEMRQTTMPAEIVKSIRPDSTGYAGHAMALQIAGEEVIVMARNLNSLNIVFNYIEAHYWKGNANRMATLRTTACPEVVVCAKRDVQLDEEL
jgi:hypothetical protein